MARLFRSKIWWFLVFPGLLVVICPLVGALGLYLPWWITMPAGVLFLLTVIYFLVSAIVWFVKKRWKFGIAATACLLIGFLMTAPAFSLAMMTAMADEDHFADDLTLPVGIELQEPEYRQSKAGEEGPNPDEFQAALLKSLETPGTSDPSVLTEIPSLGETNEKYPELLRRYLSIHPAWWYHTYGGEPYATRRWREWGEWQSSLHGYYSDFGGPSRYQTRVTLGMSGKGWRRGGERVEPGATTKLKLSQGNSLHESSVTWDEGGIAVEIFEQGESEERRMTKATIEELEKEFSLLLQNPTWEHARTLLPEGTIRSGKPGFEIFQGRGGGGIYISEIWCNPGEAGQLYLKAFEITQETPLSESRLKGRSSEFVGWSENPEELFRSSFQFTIYEGNWEQYYGARFEVWFTPLSGGPDRKLMESNWKIEGWMR